MQFKVSKKSIHEFKETALPLKHFKAYTAKKRHNGAHSLKHFNKDKWGYSSTNYFLTFKLSSGKKIQNDVFVCFYYMSYHKLLF